MTTRSAEYLEAIGHLPDEAVLLLSGVTWEEYEEVLKDLFSRPGLRVSYDQGRLEIVSPSPKHEYYKDLLLRLVVAFAEEFEIPLESQGSTTWRRRKIRKGVEPDTCFYIANATRMIGKLEIDLETDPPPDIVVEIEITKQSLDKFSIYAALGVPEIWRYDGMRLKMYELSDEGRYTDIGSSRFLPGLTDSALTDSIDLSKTHGQTETVKAFRRKIRAKQF